MRQFTLYPYQMTQFKPHALFKISCLHNVNAKIHRTITQENYVFIKHDLDRENVAELFRAGWILIGSMVTDISYTEECSVFS